MLEKFKSLSKGKKIICGIIGFSLLPITLIIVGINLLINGIKNKKIGKSIGGALVLLVVLFAFISTDDTNSNSVTDNTIETSNTKKEEPTKKEEVLTKEELLKKLETYEGIYSVIPASIQEASKSNDKFQMQKNFSDSKSILEKCWSELGSLENKYDQDSDEYKAVYNLQLAFFTLKEACEDGIKYLDKDEFKYFEKYEDNCNSSGIWLNDYNTYKEKLQ